MTSISLYGEWFKDKDPFLDCVNDCLCWSLCPHTSHHYLLLALLCNIRRVIYPMLQDNTMYHKWLQRNASMQYIAMEQSTALTQWADNRHTHSLMVISIDLDNLMITPHPEYEGINITSTISWISTKRNSDPTHTRTLVRMVFCLKSYMKIFHLRFVLFCFPCSSPPVSSSSNLFVFSETQVWFNTDTATVGSI